MDNGGNAFKGAIGFAIRFVAPVVPIVLIVLLVG